MDLAREGEVGTEPGGSGEGGPARGVPARSSAGEMDLMPRLLGVGVAVSERGSSQGVGSNNTVGEAGLWYAR